MSTIPVYGGVDTHADVHTAAVVSALGEVIATSSFPVSLDGYESLTQWLIDHGRPILVGVEGTGSYGAGLARHLSAANIEVREVARPNRQHRRRYGKSDVADAVGAARAVAAGIATGTPRSLDGPVEATRNLQVARRSAVKTRIAVSNQIHALVVTAPNQLRHRLNALTINQIKTEIDRHTITNVCDPTDATIAALQSLSAIHTIVTQQIRQLTQQIEITVTEAAPAALLEEIGVGPIVAADLIIAAGTNPHRLHSDAAFAALTGVSPVDASSGKQQRHRLNRGGDRQANAALYRAVIVRLRYHQPTRDYMTKRLAEGKTKRETIRCLKRHLARRIHHHLTT